MSESSRRGFLKSAGIGAAGVGIVAVTGNAAGAAAPPAAPAETTAPRSVKGPIVVHVQDIRTGTMSLMIEGHEVSVTDRDLAARIAGALHEHSPRAVNLPTV